MSFHNDRAHQFLKTLPFFSGMPKKEADAFLAAGHLRAYTKHQHLFLHQDKAETLYIVISGCIKIYTETKDGEESVIDLLMPGRTLGESSIFDGTIYPYSASVAEAAEVFEIRAEFLKQKAKSCPEVAAKIMEILSDGLHNLQKEKEHMATMTASQRVGCMLLCLSSGMQGKGGTFTLPYDKSLAAANLGMKPETFSRALKDLKAVGVEINGPEIRIENFDKLAGHSCAHCSSARGACSGDRRS